VFPLICPELRRMYPHIIYCDADAALQDWILSAGDMGRLFKLSFDSGFEIGLETPDSFRQLEDRVWTATLKDGTCSTYYMNCLGASKRARSGQGAVFLLRVPSARRHCLTRFRMLGSCIGRRLTTVAVRPSSRARSTRRKTRESTNRSMDQLNARSREDFTVKPLP
jgi:hypothetical protein